MTRPSTPSAPAASPDAPTPRAVVLRALAPPFGGAHFFVGARGVAAALIAVGVAGIALAWRSPPFWAALPFVAAGDVIGALARARAAKAGRPPAPAGRVAPALGLVALGIVAALPHVTPDVVAGSRLRAACAFAADCEGGETFAACVQRAADATYAGHAPDEARARACAACLDGATCALSRDACESCEGLVSLPAPPPVELPPGPIGTAPSDLQMVIPSLVPTTHAPSARDIAEEDLLRALEDIPLLPPSSAAPLPAPPAPAPSSMP